MKISLCDLFGHKWKPVYICGEYNGIRISFIGAFCKRCFKGYPELIDTAKKQTNHIFTTYNEKYFDGKIEINTD